VTGRRLRVVVVDDHRLLAQSLAISLGQEGLDCSVATLTAPDELVRSVVAQRPDVVLLDLVLGPVAGDGAALVAPLTGAGSRVVLVTGATDPVRLAGALGDGAVGVLSKTEPVEVLLAAATAAAHGQRVMDENHELALRASARARHASRTAALQPFTRLTEREAQVLRSLARGRSVAAIAATSYVAEATVRTQVRGVLTKLGVGSQLEAVALAHQARWLETDAE
jgi:DNA-binding NarL/FixJ family response regulator